MPNWEMPETLLRRIYKNPLFRYVLIAYIGALAFGMAFKLYISEFQERKISYTVSTDKMKDRLNDFDKKIAAIETLCGSFNDRVLTIEKRVPLSSREARDLADTLKGFDFSVLKTLTPQLEQLDNIYKNIEIISNDLVNLKKAINPTNVDEILTVARLGDKFELLNSEIASLRKEILNLQVSTDTKLERNFTIIDSQVDRIVDLMKWAALLLIPIIFSTIRNLLRGGSVAS